MPRNGLVELTYIKVEFERGGKQYVYSSPYIHKKGDIVLVNVYGGLKAATVVCESEADYAGTIKMIAGIGYLLEDLEQPVATNEPKSLVQLIKESILG